MSYSTDIGWGSSQSAIGVAEPAEALSTPGAQRGKGRGGTDVEDGRARLLPPAEVVDATIECRDLDRLEEGPRRP